MKNNSAFNKTEMTAYPGLWSLTLNPKALQIVFDKISKHYGLSVNLGWKGRTSTSYAPNSEVIWVPNFYMNPLGRIVHELAHAIAYKKYGKQIGDGKKLMTIIGRIDKYCKQKNYWAAELGRRMTQKVEKKPSRIDLQKTKIEHKKKMISKYEKKLAYYDKLYRHKIVKAKKSLAGLEKHLIKIVAEEL
jgi:hypothetical protein